MSSAERPSGESRPAAGRGSPRDLWTSLELVRWTTDYFERVGLASPRLDAEVLLAHALGCRRLDLYLQFERPVEDAERARYRELIKRRAQDRVPVAQLVGEREFWSRSFEVTADVLVPRPETELLVRIALQAQATRVLDFGSGSGNVAVALAAERPEIRVIALDGSRPALRVAARNLARHGVADRVQLVAGRGLACVRGPFDAIVANPPYLLSGELEGLAPELAHEPRVALDGGADGLDVVRELLRGAEARLRPGGHLLIEIGAGQASTVEALAADLGARTRVHLDLAGIERVVAVCFEGEPLCPDPRAS